jgi:capsular polysaccharide biosynthesis protein
MPLTEYLRILRRWGWILVVLAVLAAGSAYVFSAVQTPIYRSTVHIGVQPSRPDFGLSQSTKDLLRLYVSVIYTENFAAKVIDRLQLDMTPTQLRGAVTIAEDASRYNIRIDVDHVNGDVANDIARVWAEEFRAWRDEKNAEVNREDKVDAFMLDNPTYALHRPRKAINTLAGGILGVLVGGVLIFLVEYRAASVIRFAEDVERGLGLPVLGAVPPVESASAARARAARAA